MEDKIHEMLVTLKIVHFETRVIKTILFPGFLQLVQDSGVTQTERAEKWATSRYVPLAYSRLPTYPFFVFGLFRAQTLTITTLWYQCEGPRFVKFLMSPNPIGQHLKCPPPHYFIFLC